MAPEGTPDTEGLIEGINYLSVLSRRSQTTRMPAPIPFPFRVILLSSLLVLPPGSVEAQTDARTAVGRLSPNGHVVDLLVVLVLILLLWILWNLRLRRLLNEKTGELESAKNDLAVRGRTLRSMIELSYDLSDTRDRESLVLQIVHHVQEGLRFDRVGLYLVDIERGELREEVGVDDLGRVHQEGSINYPLTADHPILQVARGELDSYLTSEKETGAGLSNDGRGTEQTAFVPIKAGGKMLGVIAVDNKLTSRAFSKSEVRQLRGYADEIALALYNAQLLGEADEQRKRLAKRNRELEALVAFSRAATAAKSQEEVVRQIVMTVRDKFGFDRVGVFLAEGGAMRGVLGTDDHGKDEDIHHELFPFESDPHWHPLITGEQDYYYTEHYGVMTNSGQTIHHHLLMPLRTQNQILGLVAVDNLLTNRPFGEAEIQPLLAFARHAAMALRNVHLLETVSSSEERLRLLVTSLTETLYSVQIGMDGLIPVYYSPQLEQLTGWKPEEALSIPDFLLSIVYSEDRSKIREVFQEIQNGHVLSLQYRILHRDGEIRWVLDTPAPVRNEQGDITLINGSMMDITEQKSLEDRLRRAQKMETVGTLAGGIAHDFNNLLAIIGLNIQEAELDVPEENPARFSLTQARKAGAQAADLVEKLLSFSRSKDSKREALRPEKVLEETADLLRALVGKKITLQVSSDPETSEIFADATQLQQVLINLGVNARDAMPDGGVLTMRAQNVVVREGDRGKPLNFPAGDYVRFQVHDTGIGMDAETQQRIFEPFFTTKSLGRGTGLGLAVTYFTITEHHGWIEVQSVKGEGTLFSIYLPSLETARQTPVESGLPMPETTVLIVDRDAKAREELAGMLEKQAYFVLTAESGAEALALYWSASDTISLVICAFNLTEMDAAQLIGHLRDADPDATILLSATAEEGLRMAQNSALAAYRHLDKPYQEAKALDKVREAITQSHSIGAK